MPLYNARAIVLRSIKLSETDKLITFMTEEFGKVKCVAKSARKIKSRFGASLEPMTYVQLIFFGRQNQELYRLNQSDIIQSYQTLTDDLGKLYTGLYFIESVDSMVREHHREPEVFNLLLGALQALKNQSDTDTLCRLFEMRLLTASGYRPQLHHCTVCKAVPDTEWIWFSFHRNSIVCKSCAQRNNLETRFTIGTLKYLNRLITMDFTHIERLKFPKSSRSEIEKITHRILLSHNGREFKSYPFIKNYMEMSARNEETSR